MAFARMIAWIHPTKSIYKIRLFKLFFTAFSALCLLALIDFYPTDQSPFSASWPPKNPENFTGFFGAKVSGTLFYYFGISAWTLPLLGILSSFKRFLRVNSLFRQTLGTLSLIPVICWIVGSLPLATFPVDGYLPEGSLGTWMIAWFEPNLGQAGSILVIVTLIASSYILISDNSPWQKLSFRLPKPSFRLPNFIKAAPKFATVKNGPPICKDSLQQIQPRVETNRPVNVEQDTPPWQNPESSSVTNPSPQSPLKDLSWETPTSELFETSQSLNSASDPEFKAIAEALAQTLEEFGIKGKVSGFRPGPVVTVYEYELDVGVKQSKVISLIDDIALNLRVDSIFINPVKGKRALGIQVPNKNREKVLLGDIISSDEFTKTSSPLTFAMGKDLSGNPVATNLGAMPHLLIAGATGSGKSVGINSLLCSIIMKASPEQVRMILVDPKMLELSVYEGIPHLLTPVITEAHKASMALKWAVNEMERRYKIMQLAAVRNIESFNQKWPQMPEAEKVKILKSCKLEHLEPLPFLMIVIDELADLMLTAPKEVETMIQRLAQKARASGIHMVLATQRPSVDIITGVIKANLPSRISFQVVSKHDSRTILDLTGAEKLLGKGDLLFQRPGIQRLARIQGALVTDEEVIDLVEQVRSNSETIYDDSIIDWIETEAERSKTPSGMDEDEDSKWDEALALAEQQGSVSASFLQRQLKIGYNRAARIVESMETQNLVGPADGSKPRKWLRGSDSLG